MKNILLNAIIAAVGLAVMLLVIAFPSQAAAEDSFNLLCIGEDKSKTYIESLTPGDHERSDSDAPSGFSRGVTWYDTEISVTNDSYTDGEKFRERYIEINRLDLSFRLNDQLGGDGGWTSMHRTTGYCEIAPNRKI